MAADSYPLCLLLLARFAPFVSTLQFPGTGDLKDDGVDKGKYYAVNFPLNDGIDDKTYLSVFKPVRSAPLASPRRSLCALGPVAGCSVADASGLTTFRFWLCLLSFDH